MNYFSKISLSLITAVSVGLSFGLGLSASEKKLTEQDTNIIYQQQFNSETNHNVIKETRQNFEKKLALLNIYWDQELYQEVMTIVNYLQEKLLWLSVQIVDLAGIPFPIGLLENADVTWMTNQLNTLKQKIHEDSSNNDAVLDDFLQFQNKATLLDEKITTEMNSLRFLQWQKEEQIYHVLENNFSHIQEITRKYDLLNREVFEWENSSNYQRYLYSLDKYRQFMRLYNLITIKIKNNFHYLIKLIIESMNEEVKNLIAQMANVKDQSDLIHEYFAITSKWELLKEYQNYLLHEELQENLSSQFSQFDSLKIRLDQQISNNYPLLVASFLNNLAELKINLQKKAEKVTMYGVWEEIVALRKVFKNYQSDYQRISGEKEIEKELNEINAIFKTIHYQGINYVRDDPDDSNFLIKYMSDQEFTKMVNGYMSDQHMISMIVDSVTGAVITVGCSALGFLAGGPIGAIIGGIIGGVSSYFLSKQIDKMIDLFYGEWAQILMNFKHISKGAGVIFKMPKHYTLPLEISNTIKNTIKVQEPKFLV